MALIETPGAANANTYGTVAESLDYFGQHPYGEPWLNLSTEEQEAALIVAVRLLDAWFPWVGTATTDTQALSFPRIGLVSRNGYPIADTVIPTTLKYAQFEAALAVNASNITQQSDIEAQGITKVKAGPVEVSFAERDVVDGSVLPVAPQSVRMLIPPSWYTLPDTEDTHSLFFEVSD